MRKQEKHIKSEGKKNDACPGATYIQNYSQMHGKEFINNANT